MTRFAPEVIDMRVTPKPHDCSGSWHHVGKNDGGHNVYYCDSGRHIAIERIYTSENPGHRCTTECPVVTPALMRKIGAMQ